MSQSNQNFFDQYNQASEKLKNAKSKVAKSKLKEQRIMGTSSLGITSLGSGMLGYYDGLKGNDANARSAISGAIPGALTGVMYSTSPAKKLLASVAGAALGGGSAYVGSLIGNKKHQKESGSLGINNMTLDNLKVPMTAAVSFGAGAAATHAARKALEQNKNQVS